MMKLATVIPYVKKKKDISHMTHPLSSTNISIFSLEISNFCFIKKYTERLHFHTYLLILFEYLKVFFDYHSHNFDDVNEIGYSRTS